MRVFPLIFLCFVPLSLSSVEPDYKIMAEVGASVRVVNAFGQTLDKVIETVQRECERIRAEKRRGFWNFVKRGLRKFLSRKRIAPASWLAVDVARIKVSADGARAVFAELLGFLLNLSGEGDAENVAEFVEHACEVLGEKMYATLDLEDENHMVPFHHFVTNLLKFRRHVSNYALRRARLVGMGYPDDFFKGQSVEEIGRIRRGYEAELESLEAEFLEDESSGLEVGRKYRRARIFRVRLEILCLYLSESQARSIEAIDLIEMFYRY